MRFDIRPCENSLNKRPTVGGLVKVNNKSVHRRRLKGPQHDFLRGLAGFIRFLRKSETAPA
jgi:hypothetical protein